MSLDKFVKPDKKKEGEEGRKGPEKQPTKPATSRGSKPKKPATRAPVKKRATRAEFEEDGGEVEGGTLAEADHAGGDAVGTTAPRESALRAMGLEKYVLTCPACKFKRELHVSGELKPHQLICRKCGGTMKAGKKA
ncbi:MAG: hypothetical protein JW839_03510 [Candidatus Lokiarchaeota archaeon]|nr:hypothetical protein [Candidatus Lokiarchaeota archaeon]